MNNQVVVNPEKIDIFVSEVRNFLESLSSSVNHLNHSFKTLSNSWQNRKRNEFENQYIKLLQVLKQFENSSKEKIQYLNTLSHKAKEYLSS